MLRMTPLTVEGKPLDVAARLAELTGVVAAAARDGLPAHELERGLWQSLLQLGHDLQAAYFALAGDGDCGATLQLADGRVVKRLPEPHCRPYRSIFGDFTLKRVVYGTREGQRIAAAPLARGYTGDSSPGHRAAPVSGRTLPRHRVLLRLPCLVAPGQFWGGGVQGGGSRGKAGN